MAGYGSAKYRGNIIPKTMNYKGPPGEPGGKTPVANPSKAYKETSGKSGGTQTSINPAKNQSKVMRYLR
jgi:hypothetical protein